MSTSGGPTDGDPASPPTGTDGDAGDDRPGPDGLVAWARRRPAAAVLALLLATLLVAGVVAAVTRSVPLVVAALSALGAYLLFRVVVDAPSASVAAAGWVADPSGATGATDTTDNPDDSGPLDAPDGTGGAVVPGPVDAPPVGPDDVPLLRYELAVTNRGRRTARDAAVRVRLRAADGTASDHDARWVAPATTPRHDLHPSETRRATALVARVLAPPAEDPFAAAVTAGDEGPTGVPGLDPGPDAADAGSGTAERESETAAGSGPVATGSEPSDPGPGPGAEAVDPVVGAPDGSAGDEAGGDRAAIADAATVDGGAYRVEARVVARDYASEWEPVDRLDLPAAPVRAVADGEVGRGGRRRSPPGRSSPGRSSVVRFPEAVEAAASAWLDRREAE